MLPELSKEVWTSVLEKLKDVRDFGRLQQVSRTFNVAIADVGWTKIKSIRSDYDENVLFRVNDQDLFLPTENRLLLVAELAKKAVKITEISLEFCASSPEETKPAPMEEYAEFLGRALVKLASGPQEIRSLELGGILDQLSPMFPSLVEFIRANTKTIEEINIWVLDPPQESFETHPRLLEAIRDCSQLVTTNLRFYWSACGTPPPMNLPLFESLLSGKRNLKKLLTRAREVPANTILASGAQLVEYGCYQELPHMYASELMSRGLAVTDQHPLFTVKKLTLYRVYPETLNFSLLPNLEHVEFLEGMALFLVIPFISEFLTEFMDISGDAKVMLFDMRMSSDFESAQELANKVREKIGCQAMVKEPEGDKAVISFARGNSSLVCRLLV